MSEGNLELRTRTVYNIFLCGKSGVGKTTLLANIAISDIQRGRGCCVVDCHGDLVQDLLAFVPEDRINDVIYFNLADPEYAIGFNPLSNVPAELHHIVASGIISIFRRLYSDSWGARLEHTLRFSLLTLLEHGDATLLDIQPLLTDPAFREKILDRITTPHILLFWKSEHEKGSVGFKVESVSAVINKFSAFVASTPLRHTFGQRTQNFSIQQVLDEGKILLVNLSKGVIGQDICYLVGSIIIATIQYASFSRATQAQTDRKQFSLIIDELHNYATNVFAEGLSECRKYGLGLVLASQYLDQLSDQIRAAIFGNIGTLIAFRVGVDDARYLVREFHPLFTETDFINLGRYQFYVKLCIDGITSQGFSAISLPRPSNNKYLNEEITKESRLKYAQKREKVDNYITERFQQIKSSQKRLLFD